MKPDDALLVEAESMTASPRAWKVLPYVQPDSNLLDINGVPSGLTLLDGGSPYSGKATFTVAISPAYTGHYLIWVRYMSSTTTNEDDDRPFKLTITQQGTAGVSGVFHSYDPDGSHFREFKWDHVEIDLAAGDCLLEIDKLGRS